MEIVLTVIQQVIVIFLLIAVGFFMSKKRMLTEDGIRQITWLVLNIVSPCVLINAYQIDYDPDLVYGLLAAAGFAVITHALSILLCHLVFRKEPSKRYRINIFCSVYSNCGFMGIPLLSAVLGDRGVFYGAAYLAVFTLFYWTHGVYVYTGGDKSEISLKKAILNPGVISTIVSLILFFAQIRLPQILSDTVGYLAALNTPLPMVILGSYLAGLNWKIALKEKSVYLVCLFRLVLIPLIAIAVSRLLRLDSAVAQSVMIATACPVATVSTLFATRYRLDAEYSSEIVSISTLLSILTIPLIMILVVNYASI